jgi:hypothetical protein
MLRIFTGLVLVCATAFAQRKGTDDVILRAMQDEIERAKTLSIAALDKPYYIACTLEDVQSFSVSAGLGALIKSSESRFRVPRIRVRVGDYDFDNTNYAFSDFYSGKRYDPEQFPIDDDYYALRRGFWLATDRAYKAGIAAIARKRAALKNVAQSETLPDFWKIEPVKRIEPVTPWVIDSKSWIGRVRSLSEVFRDYAEIIDSTVDFNAGRSTYYLQTSEGTTIRRPDPTATLQVRASALAKDGTTIRDSLSLVRRQDRQMPPDDVLRKMVSDVGQNIRVLLDAPVGEPYTGPVLFEGAAGPQIVAEVLAPHLVVPRRPVGEPGRQMRFQPSELEGRVGSRILPEFLSVVDDPTQPDWKGEPLIGCYSVDEEGVVPKPVEVIGEGRLKNFLLTRQPLRGFDHSNGRARLPGSFGARSASITNLFVTSSENMSGSELRQKLLEMVRARNKPYGIIIRKMDFPSSAPPDELRRIMSVNAGAARPVSAPVLVYRVYPNGKEELIRGLVFRGLSVRSLRDIVAVSAESSVLHYLNNMMPFALVGAAPYVAPASVVAPSLLFDDLELARPEQDSPNPPLVAPPPLSASTR